MAPNIGSNAVNGVQLTGIEDLCRVFEFDPEIVTLLAKSLSCNSTSATQILNDQAAEKRQNQPVHLIETLGQCWQLPPFSAEFAERLDSLNNFSFRDQFYMPKKGTLPRDYGRSEEGEPKDTIYLCTHSLGLKPKVADEYVAEILEKWGDWGVLSNFYGKFPNREIDLPPRPLTDRLVGAKNGETTIMNGLSINLHLMLIHFYQPTSERFKILIEENAFPSDMYIVKSQLRLHRISEEKGLLLLKARPGEYCIRHEDIHDLIEREGDTIACILLPGVQYLSGQRFDIETITAWGHEKGCIVGWDLAHAVCNVPLKLHDWNVDFACWATYKYMCGGAGCHAGAFVHERNWDHDGPKLEGWWGTKDNERFFMKDFIEPALGVDSFRVSHTSVWATITVIAALEVFDQVDWAKFHSKQFWLTGYLEYVVKAVSQKLATAYPDVHGINGTDPVTIATPNDPTERGSQLTLILTNGGSKDMSEQLLRNGVICDFRYPDRIRLAPYPLYNTYLEVFNFGQILLELLTPQTATMKCQLEKQKPATTGMDELGDH